MTQPAAVGGVGAGDALGPACRAGIGGNQDRDCARWGGANAAAKVASIVAGMVTGADSIVDMDGLREGAVGKVLPGVKAPSTLGTFLRAFTFGHVRQLGAVAAGFLVALAELVPVLTGHDDHRDAVTWLDTDSRDAGNIRLRQAGRGLRVLSVGDPADVAVIENADGFCGFGRQGDADRREVTAARVDL